MIQTYVTNTEPVFAAYVNIYDIVSTYTYTPLWVLTSQLTGKEKAFIPTVFFETGKPRAALFLYQTASVVANENLTGGKIFIGNTDYPLGFYDLEIYNNSSASNLDKSGLTKLFTGLFNVRGGTNREAVTYSEYTTNDADTDSVYVTI
jgi:hypothetical protein